MAKDAYYFSHDSNAHKDPKILKLRAKHGWEGYGIYWAIIETLREQDNYKWLANDKQLLSFCFANGEAMVNQVIDTCLDVGLLVNDGEFIYSESLFRRMKYKDEISEKRRLAGKKGGLSKSLANAVANPSNKKKVKESKEKESKENNSSRHKYEICDYETAELLFKKMLENNPGAKDPDLEKWANEVRLMRERDNRTIEQIQYLINWTQNDPFWKTNILSISKLRSQWDQLVLKCKESNKSKQQGSAKNPIRMEDFDLSE